MSYRKLMTDFLQGQSIYKRYPLTQDDRDRAAAVRQAVRDGTDEEVLSIYERAQRPLHPQAALLAEFTSSSNTPAVPMFRYYLGRVTGNAAHFAEVLARHWSVLDPVSQGIIRRELEQAFSNDDRAKALKSEAVGNVDFFVGRPLGDDTNRESWELVRTAYTPASLPSA